MHIYITFQYSWCRKFSIHCKEVVSGLCVYVCVYVCLCVYESLLTVQSAYLWDQSDKVSRTVSILRYLYILNNSMVCLKMRIFAFFVRYSQRVMSERCYLIFYNLIHCVTKWPSSVFLENVHTL